MSALRIREVAEWRQWTTLEQTWSRTWPASQGSIPTRVDFQGRENFFSIPEVSFKVETSLLTENSLDRLGSVPIFQSIIHLTGELEKSK